MNTGHAIHQVAEIEIERIEVTMQRSAGPARDMLVRRLEETLKSVFEAGAASAQLGPNTEQGVPA